MCTTLMNYVPLCKLIESNAKVSYLAFKIPDISNYYLLNIGEEA